MTTGNIQGLVVSDPINRRLDKGYSFADQRHTFVMSLVARPQFNFEHRTLRRLFNNNQVGIIATANSGGTFNIISSLDLSGGGVLTSDRPVGIKRNSGTTPPQFNADLRYSRFFNFTERYRLEVFGELQNLFNINSIVGFNNVAVTTNTLTGELVGALPDFRARNQSTSQDSRQFQIGFKLFSEFELFDRPECKRLEQDWSASVPACAPVLLQSYPKNVEDLSMKFTVMTKLCSRKLRTVRSLRNRSAGCRTFGTALGDEIACHLLLLSLICSHDTETRMDVAHETRFDDRGMGVSRL